MLLYPLPEWEDIERKLVRLGNLDPRARRLDDTSFASLARSPEVRRLIQGVVDDRNRRLPRDQGIKRFAIVDHPFKIAGTMGFKEAARKAKPILLEPIMAVEVFLDMMRAGDPAESMT